MTQLGTSPTQLRELYPLLIYNGDSEAAPAHAALEITGVTLDSYDDPVYSVQKPTGTAGRLLIFNGPQAIASERYGRGAEASTLALIGSSPAINSTVGPVNDSWALTTSGTGYKTRSTVQSSVADVVRESDGEENYRLCRALVDEGSGVSQGATFTVDNITPLAGGLDPSSGVPTFTMEVNDAKQSYSDNDEVVILYDPAATDDWVDFTDVGDTTPQTYNVKLQGVAKALTDTSVSVKFLEDDLTTENGAAFDAYDPHQKFSSGKVTDAVGRVTRVTDPDTGNNRFEFTDITSLARYVTATLAENEGATTSGKASASSYEAKGNGWHVTSPTGSINIIGLDGQQAGDQVRAVLVDPDSTPQEYLAVQVPDKNDDEKVKVNTNESAAGFLEDQLVNTGTLTAGYQRVYRRVAGDDDTIYFETEEASGGTEAERIIVGQLKAPSGVAIGTATFVIDNVRPLASGTDPVGGNAATEVTINDAIGGYVDNQEIRAVWDDAENTGSGGWKDATIHRFTRIRGLVNEVSGVAHGASGWAVDGIEMLAGSANPGSTVDGYVAKQAYSNNDEVELIWNDVNVRWEDCTDVTYPSKLALAGGSGLTARSGTTPGSGTVQPKRRNTSTGNLENDGSTETWYNLAATAVAADEYVMGKAVLNSAGAVEYWVDWEECPA